MTTDTHGRGHEDAASCDVLVLTVISEELFAAKKVFGVDDQLRHKERDGTVWYPFKVESKRRKRVLRCRLLALGRAGTSHAAAFAANAIVRFRPRFVSLMGIAAGEREKTKIGQVVISEQVVAYEPAARVRKGKTAVEIPRHDAPRICPSLEQDLVDYRPDNDRLMARFTETGGVIPVAPRGKASQYRNLVASSVLVTPAVIASGDKLLRDPQFIKGLHKVHGKITAVEMEAAGLVAACRLKNIPWIVFRGISDFGDRFKSDDFHGFASRMAATALHDFLEYGLDLGEGPVGGNGGTFPPPPSDYIPHPEEPPFASTAPRRLVLGLSGTGKTAWVSKCASEIPGDSLYFDGSAYEDRVLSTSLGAAIEPMLADDLSLEPRPLIVLDNAHKLDSAELADTVRAHPRVRWLFLAHPGSEAQGLADRLAIEPEVLKGWRLEEICRMLKEHGCSSSREEGTAVQRLTGGLPLFVRSLARYVKDSYAGDTRKYCRLLRAGLHPKDSANERILGNIIKQLSNQERQAFGVLSIAECALTPEEAAGVISAAQQVDSIRAFQFVRSLLERDILQRASEGRIALHDAFRPLAGSERAHLPIDSTVSAQEELLRILEQSVDLGREPLRMIALLRLLMETRRFAVLSDLISKYGDLIGELGLGTDFHEELGRVARDISLSAEDRFWILDYLAFREAQADDVAKFAELADEAERLLPQIPSGFAAAAFYSKRSSLAAMQRDLSSAEHFWALARAKVADDPLRRRILDYNFAVALYRNGKTKRAEDMLAANILEYFEEWGWDDTLSEQEDIRAALPGRPLTNSEALELKRLADCLEVFSRCRRKRGKPRSLAVVHAIQLYIHTNHVDSVARFADEVLEELSELKSPHAACAFFEAEVLPAVNNSLHDEQVCEALLEYAKVLARIGKVRKALDILERIQADVARISGSLVRKFGQLQARLRQGRRVRATS